MRSTVQLCLRKGVAIGAHTGLPDLRGFGQREIAITPAEAYELTLYQLGRAGVRPRRRRTPAACQAAWRALPHGREAP